MAVVLWEMCVSPRTAVAAEGSSHVVCHRGVCVVVVDNPGSGGSGGDSGSSDSGGCSWKGHKVPCTTQNGYFNASDGCYYREANPYPQTGPVAVEYEKAGGGIYWASCPFGTGSGGYVWLPQPPPGVGPTPAMLAKRAFDSLTLSKPSSGRYPDGTLENGLHYTVVRTYTWYWTDPSNFKTLTAKAAAGAVWAEVTVKPTALTFTPGDGNATVSCTGPGTVWNDSYGAWAPSPSGCDYRYPHSSIHAPHNVVTATYGIKWQVTWVGSGNTSGTLPDQTTTATSTFAVAEVQSVVTH